MTAQKPKTKPLAITPRYDAILKAVHECRYVSVTHITRLFFAYPSSKTHVNEIMNRLAGGKDYKVGNYLYRFPLPNTRTGNTERLYTLGSKGMRYLQEEQGIDVPWKFDGKKIQSLSYGHLMHQVDETSLLIGVKLFSQANEQAGREPTLHEYKTEYALKPLRETVKIEVTTGQTIKEETIPVVPDLWLDFYYAQKGVQHEPILVEIDRGTEGREKFKKKIKALLGFISGPGYKKMFGVRAVTIAFFITEGERTRLDNLLKWTDEVLKDMDKKNYADTFRFCRLQPQWERDIDTLFTSPLWYRPGTENLYSLLS